MTNQEREHIIDMLQSAYSMEIESAENFLAASANLSSTDEMEMVEWLANHVDKKMEHARAIAGLIHQRGGTVQGSMQLRKNQKGLQPVSGGIEFPKVLNGVIEAKDAAIAHYKLLGEVAKDSDDEAKQIAKTILSDELKDRDRLSQFIDPTASPRRERRSSSLNELPRDRKY